MAKSKSWRNMFSGDLNRKYKDAIDYLDENFPFFLTHVLNIGSPEYSSLIPTAAVSLPKDGEDATDFEFLFNEDFLEFLSTQDTAFILAHETMHIVLNHLVLSRSFANHKRITTLDKQRRDSGLSVEEAQEMTEETTKMMIFNIAADCVINDYLHDGGLETTEALKVPTEDGKEKRNALMRGHDQVGHNCANATVTEVFDELWQKVEDFMKQNQCQTCKGTGRVPQKDQQGQSGKDKQDGSGDKEQENGESGGDQSQDGQQGNEPGDGQGGQSQAQDHNHGDKGDPCPDCQGTGQQLGGQGSGGMPIYTPLDSHDWMHKDMTAKDIKNLEDLWDQIKDAVPQDVEDMRDDLAYDSAMKMAGDEAGAINQFAVEKGVSLEWILLLKEIDPDLFKGKGPLGPPPKASWHQKPRKISAFPETILPVKRIDPRRPEDSGHGTKKPSIVMALDTSGSISRRDAARFIALAQSVPQDKMHMYTITFTTEYNVLDLDNPRYGSGGTSFSAIERYIQRDVVPELGHYPKAVVVITDGYASFDREKVPNGEEDSWFWLLTENGSWGYYDASSKIGKNRNLDDFVDKGRY